MDAKLFDAISLCVFLSIFNGALWQTCKAEHRPINRVLAIEGRQAKLECKYSLPSEVSEFIQLVWKRQPSDETLAFTYCESGSCSPKCADSRYELDVDFQTSGHLTINNVQVTDEGKYACDVTASGTHGRIFDFELMVQVPPKALLLYDKSGNPLVTVDNSIALSQGENFEVRCVAMASRPASSITWYLGDKTKEPFRKDEERINHEDDRLYDAESRLLIGDVSRADHRRTLTCRAEIGSDVVQEIDVMLTVEGPPDEPIEIKGLDDVVAPSTLYITRCVASNSYPASVITWYVDGRNVTDMATSEYTVTSAGLIDVISELRLTPSREDDGKTVECHVSHVTYKEPFIARRVIHVNKVWILEVIFGIIAAIVLTAFMIVVIINVFFKTTIRGRLPTPINGEKYKPHLIFIDDHKPPKLP